MRWSRDPGEKKAFFEAQFAREKADLEKELGF